MGEDPHTADQFLRHTVATLAYRGAKVMPGVNAHFSEFLVGATSRTPGEILAHIGDLLDWALSIVRGQQAWHDSSPQSWEKDTARFFEALRRLDEELASHPPPEGIATRVFQGPVADALTHVGQIAMLRRLAGTPVKGENYFKAEIVTGRVGPEQSVKRVEFE
ncbi:MAG: hypothetical protein WB699_11385 [Bacteroidota bacterium]